MAKQNLRSFNQGPRKLSIFKFLTCASSSSWSLRTSASSPALPEGGGFEGEALTRGMRGEGAETMGGDVDEDHLSEESTTQERRVAAGRRTTLRDAPCALRDADSSDLSISRRERLEKKKGGNEVEAGCF